MKSLKKMQVSIPIMIVLIIAIAGVLREGFNWLNTTVIVCAVGSVILGVLVNHE